MLRCCWSDSSVSEELRRVSAATLEGGGRATTDARGVETGIGKEPGQATGDAMRCEKRRLTTPRACLCVDASVFGWGVVSCVTGWLDRGWAIVWGRAVLGWWVWWIGWRAMTPVVVLVLRKPSVGQRRRQRRTAKRGLVGRQCPAELSNGKMSPCVGGRSECNESAISSLWTLRWDGIQSGPAWGLGW